MAPEDLLFGDQMGCNLAMTPAFGRAPEGQRVRDTVPGQRGKNVSTMGVLAVTGMLASQVIHGSFKGDSVLAFLEEQVASKLKSGQVLILDNARIHKKNEAAMRDILSQKGCRLVFLPPYSPEWNPIENAWSKMKGLIRRAKARTHEALLAAIALAVRNVTSDDARAWFGHCGHV